jgi:hypothetical protein
VRRVGLGGVVAVDGSEAVNGLVRRGCCGGWLRGCQWLGVSWLGASEEEETMP